MAFDHKACYFLFLFISFLTANSLLFYFHDNFLLQRRFVLFRFLKQGKE